MTFQTLSKKFDGAGLSFRYNSSVYAMLKEVYPEHDWLPWEFERTPPGVSRDPEVLEKAVSYIEKRYNITDPTDWYHLSDKFPSGRGIGVIFRDNGGLFASLKLARPNFPWEEEMFDSRLEVKLKIFLRKLFPKLEIIRGTQSDPIGPNSYLIQELKLAFDWAPPFDIVESLPQKLTKLGRPKKHSDLLKVLRNPSEKTVAAEECGLTYIAIPEWWDMALSSLVASIVEKKPSLMEDLRGFLGDTFTPIPNWSRA